MFKSWGSCVQRIPDSTGKINEIATISCAPAIFLNVLSALLAFAGMTVLAMFLMGSLKFLTSAGDAKKIGSAVNNFKFAMIGLGIVMSSLIAINVISQITGVTCITKFGFGCQ